MPLINFQSDLKGIDPTANTVSNGKVRAYFNATSSGIVTQSGAISSISVNSPTNVTVTFINTMMGIDIKSLDSNTTITINGIGPIPIDTGGYSADFDPFTNVIIGFTNGFEAEVRG